MIHWIQTHLVDLAIGAGSLILLPLAFWAAKKYIPVYIAKGMEILLLKMLNPNVENPRVKACLVKMSSALIELAEAELSGQPGADKKAWVVAELVKRFPKLADRQAQIAEIVQLAFDAMEKEMREHSGGK
jgi:hypothetical protein